MVRLTSRRRVLAGAVGLGVGATAGGCLGLDSARGGKERVRVALPRSNPPFAYRNRCCTWEANPLDGFDVALFDQLAERLELETTYVDAADDGIERLRAGDVRVFAPGRPLPRQPPDGTMAVDPTLSGYVCPLVRSSVQEPEDLAGRTVVALPGPGLERAIDRLQARVGNVDLLRVPDATTASERFAAGAGAAILANQVTVAAIARERVDVSILSGDGATNVVETPYFALASVRFGYFLRSGGDLHERLSAALDTMRGTEAYASLRGQFFRPDGIPRRDPG